MHLLSDSSLVARCIRRERPAWNEFVERFSSLVFWAIKNKLEGAGYAYNRQDLEDIFQNVFVLLWDRGKLKQLRNRQNISGWLVMVAANCAHNFFRNKKALLLEEEALEQQADFTDVTAEKSLDRESLQVAVDEAFRLLPANEVIILKLSYLYNKTYRQISQILNLPEGTVSSVIKRAKEKVRQRLKQGRWENF